jgi:uncharacterized protein (TIGR02145 family)
MQSMKFWTRTQYATDIQRDVILRYESGGMGETPQAAYDSGLSVRFVKTSTTLTDGQSGTYTGNDGKVYRTICIGTQEWLADNLNETKYRNSFAINYGSLYNWYAASKNGGTGSGSIAPSGWHLPTKTEFETLVTELGGSTVAGGHLKEKGFNSWLTPNQGADNSVLFNAKGSGFRKHNTGQFTDIRITNALWSITTISNNPYTLQMIYNVANSYVQATYKNIGNNIRLIKDNSTDEGTVTDYDGNVYPTVKIGNQVWMAASLIVQHYNDGTAIPFVTSDSAWIALTTDAMCHYGNTESNSFVTGDIIPVVIYNTSWAALTTGARCSPQNDDSNL